MPLRLLLALLAGAPIAQATTPYVLSHSGYLLSTSDTPVNDSAFPMSFSLYPSAGATTADWTATGCSVNVRGGYYAVSLGDGTCGTGIPQALFADANATEFLEVVANGVTLTPRAPLTLRSGTADLLDGHPASDFALAAHTHTASSVTDFGAAVTSAVGSNFLSTGGGTVTGNVTVNGNVTVSTGSISGNGTAITGLSATNLSTGTLPSSVFPQRMKRFALSVGDFVVKGGGNAGLPSPINFSIVQVRSQAPTFVLPNDANNVATATFAVPADYVAGQSFPKLTVYWGTDEFNSPRHVDVDVSWLNLSTSSISATTAVPFRYNFRQGGSSSANAMDSLNPAQCQIVAQTMPRTGDAFAGSPSWSANDMILLSIGRNGDGADPNSGNMYVYGLAFDYLGDR